MMDDNDEPNADEFEYEDGYTSPAGSLYHWDSPEVSSPVRPCM